MTLQQINYALRIQECGSVNKAAEKLYVSQPSLTNAIHELESEMGITIFLRTHKGITPTLEGLEFLNDIRNLNEHFNKVVQKYKEDADYKRRFAVSTQHYSFAVKAFAEVVKRYDTEQFEFVIRETHTKKVITDVGTLKSDIGVLYMSGQNRKVLMRALTEQELEFHHIVSCKAQIYMCKDHPLASRKVIRAEELEPYICLSFEQGDDSYFYAEEIIAEHVYQRAIKACDRGTMLNLLTELNGYTICSGIIADDAIDNNYVLIPFCGNDGINDMMEIGYIVKKHSVLSHIGEEYIGELSRGFEDMKNPLGLSVS